MVNIDFSELKDLLDEKYLQYNTLDFIETDPISIPHLFSKKEDIEISAFLAATMAWGQRPTTIKNAKKLVELMEYTPLDFILNFTTADLKRFESFKHRTFNGIDCVFFLQSLQNIYTKYHGLERVFSSDFSNIESAIHHFRQVFFEIEHPQRTQKHVANPMTGSSAKRINMFLRWMVRKKQPNGVDFGIWKKISPAMLQCPLDVHTGNVGRKLGLLQRQQNDWKAVQELTKSLRKFDPTDPVKYDFALFGLGVFDGF